MEKPVCHIPFQTWSQRTEAKKVLSEETIDAGSYRDVVVDAVADEAFGFTALVLHVKVSQPGDATGRVRVIWMYSPDGVNFDSEEDAVNQGNYVDIALSGEVTVFILLLSDKVRVRIRNQDGTYSASVDMWKWYMR